MGECSGAIAGVFLKAAVFEACFCFAPLVGGGSEKGPAKLNYLSLKTLAPNRFSVTTIL